MLSLCHKLCHDLGHGRTQEQEPFTFDKWQLCAPWLRPTTKALEQQCRLFADVGTEDLLISFDFPGTGGSAKKQMHVHRSLLVSTGGALKTLVTSGFRECNSRSVTVYDSYEVWQLIRNFLYRVPMMMYNVNPETVMVAHRYELFELFCACFLWIEISGLWEAKALVQDWLEVVGLVQPPRSFCEYFAVQFSLSFDCLAQKLEKHKWKVGTQNVWIALFSRGIFPACVKLIIRTSKKDHSLVLLNALFTDLEGEASEEQARQVLQLFDWESGSFLMALTSETARKWSARSWRMLRLTPRMTAPKGSFDLRMRCRVPFRLLRLGKMCSFKGRCVSPKDELGVVNVIIRVRYEESFDELESEEYKSLLVMLRIRNKHKRARYYNVAGTVFLIREPCTCRVSGHKDFSFTEREACFRDSANEFEHEAMVACLLEEGELMVENDRCCDDCMWTVGLRMRFSRKTALTKRPCRAHEDPKELRFAQLPALQAQRIAM